MPKGECNIFFYTSLTPLSSYIAVQCTFIMRMHMLNPLTTREFSAQKLEDGPDAGPADASGESSERWLILAVSPSGFSR